METVAFYRARSQRQPIRVAGALVSMAHATGSDERWK